MRLIRIEFRDGTIREFKHEGRAGGSWTKTIEFKDGWATVTDEYGNRFTYPESTIRSVETKE